MTICAVVDSTNLVINVIVAEPTDPAPDGCQLIICPDIEGNYPSIGWSWNGTIFIDPNPLDLSDYSYGN